MAAVYAVTIPQTFREPPALTVTVAGGRSCPEAFRVPFRQRLAPRVIRPLPSMAVPAAIGNVWPPIVIEPGEEAVAAVYADVDRQLWPAAELSVQAQLAYLAG